MGIISQFQIYILYNTCNCRTRGFDNDQPKAYLAYQACSTYSLQEYCQQLHTVKQAKYRYGSMGLLYGA